jgi:hypothetical protein
LRVWFGLLVFNQAGANGEFPQFCADCGFASECR